jgi:hypothetical protein
MTSDVSIEEWRGVMGHDGYQVSNIGRVRSIDRWVDHSDGKRVFYKGKLLQLRLNKDGYLKVTLFEKSHRVHRMIANAFLGIIKGEQVDHVDGNRSNNSISNLRICTHAQNQANSKLSKANKSGYKGVYWFKKRGKWKAQICLNNKQFHIGLFSSKEEAAYAYDCAATEKSSEFAKTNLKLGLIQPLKVVYRSQFQSALPLWF